MIRAILLSNTWYCKEIDSIDRKEAEKVESFHEDATLVLYADSIESIEYQFPDLRIEVVE